MLSTIVSTSGLVFLALTAISVIAIFTVSKKDDSNSPRWKFFMYSFRINGILLVISLILNLIFRIFVD